MADGANKYTLTDEIAVLNGKTLHRIKALKSFGNVNAGELGGYVENEANLSQIGNSWVSGNAQVFGNAQVSGNAQVFGNAQVSGDAWVCGNARVCSNARVYGGALVCSNARVYGDARVCDNARVYGGAQVCGNACVADYAQICSCALVYGGAQVYDNAWVYDSAWVYGDAQVCGNARVYGNARICNGAEITLTLHYLQIGQIGSRHDTTTFYRDKDNNPLVVCGCFTGTIDEFEAAVKAKHSGNPHEDEYLAAIALARIRAKRWKQPGRECKRND